MQRSTVFDDSKCDVGERCVRCPETLGTGHTLARVLEHTGHRVAILQRDGGGLRI